MIFHKFLYFSCGNCGEKARAFAGNGGYLSNHAIWEECKRTDVGLPVSKSHTISRSTRLLYRRYIYSFFYLCFSEGVYLMVQFLRVQVKRSGWFQKFEKKYMLFMYTAGWNVWWEWFLAGNQANHLNFDPSLLCNKLWCVFMGIKQKKIFFLKK